MFWKNQNQMTILMHPKVSLTPHIGAATKPKIELEQNLLHKLSVYWSNHLNFSIKKGIVE
jgi:phosphoglycerate dehydrogenase-like enzyme